MKKNIYRFLDRIGTKSLIPLSIFLVAILSMGIFFHKLGLYGDQWAQVYQPSIIPNDGLLDNFIQNTIIQQIGENVVIVHLINDMLFVVAAYLLFLWLHQLNFGLNFSLAASLLFMVSPAFRQPGAGFELSSILIGLITSFLSAIFFGKTLLDRRYNKLFIGITVLFSVITLLTNPYVVCFQSFVFLPALIVIKKKDFIISKWWVYLGLAINALVAISITIQQHEVVA